MSLSRMGLSWETTKRRGRVERGTGPRAGRRGRRQRRRRRVRQGGNGGIGVRDVAAGAKRLQAPHARSRPRRRSVSRRDAQKKKKDRVWELDEEDYEIAGVDRRKRLRRVGDDDEPIRAQTREELERQIFADGEGPVEGLEDEEAEAAVARREAAAAQRRSRADAQVGARGARGPRLRTSISGMSTS